MRMTDFQNMCGLSMAYRLRGQQARGHTDGVLAYVAYEGCWCMEHQLCDFCAAMACCRSLFAAWTRWRLVESSNPGAHRFEETDATVKDRELRHCAVAAKKFCIKLAHNAVAVRTTVFYAVPCFKRAPFPAQVPRRDTSWNSALRNVQAHSTNWQSLLVPPGPDSWRL